MINFQRMTIAEKDAYEQILFSLPDRSCEYSFANLYLWGRQQVAFLEGSAAFFSHFNGKTVYPYPIGTGDKQTIIRAILEDARQRGIPCRFTGLTEADCRDLENWFPERFHFHCNRDSFDYVYDINALADLRGKKLQKKRNHFNRFQAAHPDYRVVPLEDPWRDAAAEMVSQWYLYRRELDPDGDYLLESIAINRAFRNYDALGFEGIAIVEDDQVLAIAMGTRLSATTYDIHFEKGREDVDGTYAAVNCEFARYLRLKHPELQYLNREDDMGIEGLRKAKLSYQPHHLMEKCWAFLREDIYDD